MANVYFLVLVRNNEYWSSGGLFSLLWSLGPLLLLPVRLALGRVSFLAAHVVYGAKRKQKVTVFRTATRRWRGATCRPPAAGR